VIRELTDFKAYVGPGTVSARADDERGPLSGEMLPLSGETLPCGCVAANDGRRGILQGESSGGSVGRLPL
jgi:hypothetical protein